jgi:predicted dehydrogenase
VIPVLQHSNRNQLLAVASRSQDLARDYAKEWNIPRAQGSYQALLDDEDIDVVYISLPNSLHAEWTIRAAQSGKHVLCEKPLALSIEEVNQIEEAARQANVVVAEAFMYRHHPQTDRVKTLVEVRLNPDLGGGSVWDVGCYPISYARFILGEEPLSAFGWQMTGKSGVDEYFSGQLLFPGEILMQFDCGFRAPFRTEMEIVGSEGVIRIPHPFKPGEVEHITLSSEDGEQQIEIPGEALYQGEVEDIADAVNLGRPAKVSLEDSRGNVAAILALLRSARIDRPVTI